MRLSKTRLDRAGSNRDAGESPMTSRSGPKKSTGSLLALAITFALLTAVVVWITQCTVIYIPRPLGIESGWGKGTDYAFLDLRFTPRWSEDGSKIVFYYGHRAYFVASADASSVREVERGLSPDISPDGSHLVYIADGNYYDRLDDRGIMWEPTDAPDWVMMTSHTEGNTRQRLGENLFGRSPTWSPDGSRIAFVDHAVQVAVLNDGEINPPALVYDYYSDRTVGEDGTGIEARGVKGLAWSPSSDELTFVVQENSTPSGRIEGWSLYVASVESAIISRLFYAPAQKREDGSFTYPGFIGGGGWSPDGETIALQVFGARGDDRDGDAEEFMRLLTINRASGHVQEVASLPHMRHDFAEDAAVFITNQNDLPHLPTLDWSPDGSRILFSAWSDDAGQLFTVDADGSNLRKVSDDIFAVFSPDGSRIAAVARQPYNRPYPPDTVLYTMNLRGEDIRVLVRRNNEGRLEAVNKPPPTPTPGWLERAWDMVIP